MAYKSRDQHVLSLADLKSIHVKLRDTGLVHVMWQWLAATSVFCRSPTLLTKTTIITWAFSPMPPSNFRFLTRAAILSYFTKDTSLFQNILFIKKILKILSPLGLTTRPWYDLAARLYPSHLISWLGHSTAQSRLLGLTI